MLNVEIHWNICHNGSSPSNIKELEMSFCPVPGMEYKTHVGPGNVMIKEVVIQEDGDTVRVYLEDFHVETEEIQDELVKQLSDRGWVS